MVIAITNRKGGAGKTTVAHNLTAYLSRQGYKVIAIDLDPQGNLTFSVNPGADATEAYDLFTTPGTSPTIIEYGGFYSGSVDLAKVGQTNFKAFSDNIKRLKTIYNYVLIDTPPEIGALTTYALLVADYVLIPSEAAVYSIQGISGLYDSIRALKAAGHAQGLQIAGVVLTRYQGYTNNDRTILEIAQAQAEAMGTKVYPPIRQSTVVPKSQLARQDLFKYAPNNPATDDFMLFADEFIIDTKGGAI